MPTDNTSSATDSNVLKDDDDTNDATALAARRAVLLTRELYRRRVWTDVRTVAILATGVQSSLTKVATSSMRFFLGIEDRMADDKKQEEEEAWSGVQSINLHQHSKKTNKRGRVVTKQIKTRMREQKKRELDEEMEAVDQGVEGGKKLFPAIQLLRDPQGLAERVLKRLVRTGAGGYRVFEVKVLAMNFVTRLVGNHELMLLPLYPFLRKYMGGHQRDVTSVLAYAVQACHNTVPPEEIHGLLKTIAHNFVTERCSGEQMAVGINACRAICSRAPSALVVDEEDAGSSALPKKDRGGIATNAAVMMDIEAFARDLAGYHKHRDRSVAVAGRAWQNMIRDSFPSLLAGKDRGRTGAALHKAGEKPLRYGETDTATGIKGADLLVEYESKKAAYLKRKEKLRAMGHEEEDSSSSDEDGEKFEKMNDSWVDVEDQSDNEEMEVKKGGSKDSWVDVGSISNNDADESEEDDGEDSEDECATDTTANASDDETVPSLLPLKEGNGKTVLPTDDEPDTPKDPNTEDDSDDEETIDLSKMTKEERSKLEQHISSTRVFTSSDLKKIAKLVERQERARRDPRVAARTKRRLAQGKIDFEELSDDNFSDSDSDDDAPYVKGAVRNYEIMASARKKRANKVERLEKILSGREKFEFKTREGGSTNTEKKRKKSFLMTKFSFENRTKQGSKETARRGTLKKNKKSRVKEGSNQKRRRRS